VIVMMRLAKVAHIASALVGINDQTLDA
jgi:hypothetical protein